MKKKLYEKPSMKVYELKQQPQLLAGSFTGNRNNPYGEPVSW
jgi:hypothetical protein